MGLNTVMGSFFTQAGYVIHTKSNFNQYTIEIKKNINTKQFIVNKLL